MTKAEIMNCAAILAAGVMANRDKQPVYGPDDAVTLMEEIAEVLQKRTAEEEREYRQI